MGDFTDDRALDDRAVAARRRALAAPDAVERAAALDWLGEYAPESLTWEDAPLLRDADLAVRAAAAVACRASADLALVNAARLALRELVQGSIPERHAGLRAAARLANPTLAPRLLPLLADPDPETRRLTLVVLAAIPPGLLEPTYLLAPARHALDDVDPGVRAAARAVLARR